MKILSIKNLNVSLGNKKLLHDVNLDVARGAIHILSGANGSGKTTLAQVIAGNPEYNIDSGEIIFDGNNVTGENATTRALSGIFLGGQHVPEIPGLTVMSFLRHSMAAHVHFQTKKLLSSGLFFQKFTAAREKLNIPESWAARSINVGFSGGERKRLMFLRLILTEPKLAILDEPDAGTDTDAQNLFASVIDDMNKAGTTFLIISHQQNFKDKLNPSATTILKDGNIVI